MVVPFALLLSLLSQTPPQAHADEGLQKESGIDGLAAPIVSYSSDLGLGFGAVGGAYIYGKGYRPYRHALALQTFFTTRGIQNHFLRYDAPALIGRVRLEARLEYKRETLSPFYGAGNISSPEFSNDFRDRRFNYLRTSPAGWLRLRGRPLGEESPLQAYLGYSLRLMQVEPYEGSILTEDNPTGLEGGWNGQVTVGVLWDTRDQEADPRSGGMEEISFRLSNQATGGHYEFAGFTLGERRFWSLGPRWVFAQRLALDAMFGEVPFFEWTSIGGVSFTEGIGGMSTVRGVPRNRFAGNIKVLSNSELRFQITPLKLFRWTADFGAVAFLDVGRVWHPGVDDGGLARWHPGVGGGLRLSRRSAVLRADIAVSTETWQRGYYVTFGHLF